MSPTPPSPPTDALSAGGWVERDRRESTVFDATVVTVDAFTVVYENVSVRERIRETTGIDRLWGFFVASRLSVSPATKPSPPLTRLVANRAQAGFADTLTERGFEGVRRSDAAAAAAADALGEDARVAIYEALCRLDGVDVRARGWVAVRPTDENYLLVGGAYPTAVRDAPDRETDDEITAVLDPDGFREELFALMRGTE